MAEDVEMPKEDFLVMARHLGLDTSDSEHMDVVYEHVKEFMGVVKELRKLDLGDVEPSNTFSPAKR